MYHSKVQSFKIIKTDSFATEITQKLLNDKGNLKTLATNALSTLKKLLERLKQADELYSKLSQYSQKFQTLSKGNGQAFGKLVARLNPKADQDKEALREVFLICKYLGDQAKYMAQHCSIMSSIIDSELPRMIFSSKKIDPYVAHELFICKFEVAIDFAMQK